jgi:nicotinate dehydrogenase subunit A
MAGQARSSCDFPAWAAEGTDVTTVEGLAAGGTLHAVQQAFIEEQAAQCGYCIPGMMMRAQGLLEHNASPSDAQIRDAMAPNLCRCGTQMRILRAVRRAAKAMMADAGTIRETAK